MSRSGEPFLSVEKLSKRFGGVHAVNDVSFVVYANEIMGLIGPNGAGKTTTFNLISGTFPCSSGTVRLEGRPLAGLRADRVIARGLARTFQGTRIFRELTVEENLQTAFLSQAKVGFWEDWLGLKGARATEADASRGVSEILSFIGLTEYRNVASGALAYAHQSLLGIGLALALRPRLLLLDEPFAGMNPGETKNAAAMVRRIRDTGITVLLVEHDVAAVMNSCDRIVVLDRGIKIAEGSPDEIRRDPRVIEAYLGVDADA